VFAGTHFDLMQPPRVTLEGLELSEDGDHGYDDDDDDGDERDGDERDDGGSGDNVAKDLYNGVCF